MIRHHARGGGRNERSLEQYLREIGRYPLLAREDEIRLARRIHQGDEEAVHEMVRANLRFVVTVAKQYMNQGLSLQDLINEGNLGLMKAAHRFDEKRGFKFISYAVWWIRQSILQALSDQSRVVRLPQNRTAVLHRVTKAQAVSSRFWVEIPDPTRSRTIAGTVNPRCARRSAWANRRHISTIYSPTRTAVATSRPWPTDPERGAEIPLLERSRRDDIAKALEVLPAREAEILLLYYGMGEVRSLTLEEIGQRMSLTRERIRQLKERALRRLREADQGLEVLRMHYDEG